MSVSRQFHQLIQESRKLPPGALPVSMLEEAVRMADAHLDTMDQFYGRSCLINACFAGGKPLPLFVALAWNLAVLDKKSFQLTPYQLDELLWHCKHAISYSPSFTTVSYDRFQQMLGDVLKRYSEAGFSPRPVYQLAAAGESFMGHQEIALELHETGKTFAKDSLSETPPWELYLDIHMLFAEDREDEAISRIEPMLADPRRAEDVDPWFVYLMLFRLLDLDREQEAIGHHQRVIAKIQHNPKFVSQVGNHASFLASIGRESRALVLIEKHFDMALAASDQYTRLIFSLHGWFLMQRLANQGETDIAFRIPQCAADAEMTLPLPESDRGRVATQEMANWFEQDHQRLVEAFNQRNGNSHISTYFEEMAGRM